MNLPTKITIVRILLIPFMVVAFYLTMLPYNLNYIISTALFVLASCTDFLDGHLARSRGEVTDLGKFLDPIADKILVVAGLFLIVDMHLMPFIWGSVMCLIILSREFIISALRQMAATKGLVLSANNLGKIKTVILNVAMPFLMLGPVIGFLYYIGIVLFIIGFLITLISGIYYLIDNKKVFENERTDN